MVARGRGPRAALVAVAVATLSAGCARGTGAGEPPWPVAGFRVFESATSSFVPFERLVARARAADLVFFGEQHDDPETHRAELALLERVAADRGVVVSLEMFERDVQPELDRYLAGEIDESRFVARARPWPRYATDYRPLVELARLRRWPVLASNVPRALASAVSRKGVAALDTLAAAERAWASAELQCPHDAYYERFVQAMPAHGTPGSAPPDTATQRATNERFYLAQCLKDETMGESIARAAAAHADAPLIVHFNGAFHSDFGDGAVARAARRLPNARRVLVSAVPLADLTAADGSAHARRADFVIFTARVPSK